MSRHPPIAPQRLAMSGLKRLVFNPDVPFEKQRARLRMATKASGGGSAVTSVHVGGVRCDQFVPATLSSQTVLVYVHGGGYCVGSPDLGRALIASLAELLGLRALLVDYRLAPEHPAPAAVDDVRAVLAAVGENVVTIGDSAGAGALVAALQSQAARATVLISPWLDLSVSHGDDLELVERDPVLSPEWLEMCAAAYAGVDRSNPLVSPLQGELRLPPTMLVGGTDDILNPDAGRLFQHLTDQSTPVVAHLVVSMWHDFALSVGRLLAADTARDDMAEFLSPHIVR